MKKTKPSVTQIIWEIYPFDNTFFLKSLWPEGMDKKKVKWELVAWGTADRNGFLDYDRVMDVLSSFGTVIHQCAFDYGTLGFAPTMEWTIYEAHLRWLYEFFEQYQVRAVAAEVFVDTPEYCGISDWVFSLLFNWVRKNILLDWKTYGAYKYIYGIQQEFFTKKGEVAWRKDDFKKLSIQLALYERGFSYDNELKDLQIDGYAVVWITQEGTFMHEIVPNIQPFLVWAWKKEAAKNFTWLTL